MANPFITERANYDLSRLEREYRKRPENKWIEENLTTGPCVNGEVASLSSWEELGKFVGKFDLSLLAQLTALKAMSVSPTNFVDFLAYLDQTISYFSCIFSANLDTIDNKSPKGKSFDWGAFALSIPFDFLKLYGIGIVKLLERIALEIVKKIFLEILDVIDCDKINKCVVPCNPNQNPYQKLFVKPLIKESMNTGIFFAEKIVDGKFDERGFQITDKEMKEYVNKAIQRLAPDELECLLNGFISTSVVQFLIELFKDHTGQDATSSDIRKVFEDINVVVDLIPYTPESIPLNPCGLISLDAIARIRLRRQGISDEEIDNRMNLVIQESQGKLQTIVDFLQQLPATPPNFDNIIILDDDGNIILNQNGIPVTNSPITTAVINSSIDLIFNSIGATQEGTQLILDKILVHPLGELCIAYYWTNWFSPVQDDIITVGESSGENPLDRTDLLPIKNKIEIQLSPQTNETYNLDVFSMFSELPFYLKYSLVDRSKFEGYKISIETNGTLRVYEKDNEKFNLIGSSFTDIEHNLVVPVIFEKTPMQYRAVTNRNNLLEVLKTYNSSQLFTDTVSPVLNQNEQIYRNLYSNMFSYMDSTIAKQFFFQEFHYPAVLLNKKKFSKLNYFDIPKTIRKLKEEINA